jgi:tetratricopeptide (TPR) repeat protein
MNNLGELYRQAGDYEKAFSLDNQALEIFEKIGLYYKVRREYKMALPLYEYSLIIENEMDPQHSNIAVTLSNLAVHYASTLNNIGLYYKVRGKPEMALPLYEQSLTISENEMDPQHPDIAVTLSNIAGLYVSILEYKKATLHYKRAIKILKKNLKAGDQNPATIIKYASTLNGYAELWRHMRRYKISLIYHTKTLDFRKSKLGPEHIDVASSLHNLGCLYCDIGDYDKAIPLFEKALDIIDNNLGTSNPQFTQIMNNLIFTYGK